MVQYKKQKGQFIKHCPCSPGAIPCGYYNMNLHTGCPFDCSYCILQSYLESKTPVFFTNLDRVEKELKILKETHPHLRIGTGELTDSLAYDTETQYSQKILRILEKFPDIIFEFKTKSTNIMNLMVHPKVLKNVVIAWSVNPEKIIKSEEYGTPGLKQRLEAMQAVQSRGYKIGIHFDPIIVIKNWEMHYEKLVLQMREYVDPASVSWWSLGALRFPYSLREHIFSHKESKLFGGELVHGFDGKYRYFKPLRIELFRFISEKIFRNISKDIPLYLCMEDRDTWKEILPDIEPDEQFINKYLYDAHFKNS